MIDRGQWLVDLELAVRDRTVDGLVPVHGYRRDGRPPEEVAMMDKAEHYGAEAVFFEAAQNDRPPVAQAFIFVSARPANDPDFAELHQRLWSWGGVPLLYRKTHGLVQLFRCAHKPDFVSARGKIVCNPIRTLVIGGLISDDPWWDASRLRNGTLWDDPAVCKEMLSGRKAAHKRLLDAVEQLDKGLNEAQILKKHLRRRLLILSLLIAYLEERRVFQEGYFSQFLNGAERFFQVLADGEALIKLLADLESRFNGNVFILDPADRETLKSSNQLARFARLIEGRQEKSGQLTLWELYSFKDLPVELISHIYQMFVKDDDSVYTPPFLVRLMLDEALSWERLDRLERNGEVILDPSCGSGVFLVEAYKRLVLHWRSRNNWKEPDEEVLKTLLSKLRGIDLEGDAVQLAAFSLCLALCDALKSEVIRASVKLFPPLVGKTLHHICFFEAKETAVIDKPVGAVVGNPPFKTSLSTLGAERSYERYSEEHGSLPDKQLAYLFLHESMSLLVSGGVLSMLQQYSFLYNQQSLGFRRTFLNDWDVREVLDFISVRGLFSKGGSDTKVVVVVAEATSPPIDRKILHATFRRTGRVEAKQGFDIDYYDLHWVPRDLALRDDSVWRAGLFGGGRVLEFGNRLKQFQTLSGYAEAQGWDFGEGFIEGKKGHRLPAKHLTGKRLLPSTALSSHGVDPTQITKVKAKRFKSSYTKSRFTPPMLLIREHMDIPHDVWTETYLTYTQQIVGFCGRKKDLQKLRRLKSWISRTHRVLQAHVALTSPGLFIQKATSIQADDVFSLPYSGKNGLDLSQNEQILVKDIVDHYREFIRLGGDSEGATKAGQDILPDFTNVFTGQINTVYKNNPLRVLPYQAWPGVICQPFVFGNGNVDWSGSEALEGKLDSLLREQRGESLFITRIARIYDSNFIFLLKPDRPRYWLPSIALRDADETLADLRAQGF
jgi:hypothetical protein